MLCINYIYIKNQRFRIKNLNKQTLFAAWFIIRRRFRQHIYKEWSQIKSTNSSRLPKEGSLPAGRWWKLDLAISRVRFLSAALKICYSHVTLSSDWFYIFLNAHAQNPG